MIPRNTNPIVSLSKREKEIFMLLLSGHRTKAIADKLCLKSNTISTVIKNLKIKTETKTLVDLINLGQKYGYSAASQRLVNYTTKLIEMGYCFSHAVEIGRGKKNLSIRFEYWSKSNTLHLAEVVNGDCTTFFAQLTSGFSDV